ncbi:MAG TPA: thioredoxin domain-containing protein [Bauldia sp.]|nr:thioredoxin domain-containing protein [Bauldia sp.]
MSENLLRNEVSPYLLQHADNPVHWRPWGAAALAAAKAEGKPILLSVGYAACHWCHVMAHESFEDATTAEVINRLYVAIKVDREERPDIDQIYMGALHSLGEQGGWPLTMFLTPEGAPVWGGTYFPKTARYGRPAFVDILEEVARLFREEPAKIAQNRDWVMHRLAQRTMGEPAVAVDGHLLDIAGERLLSLMDPEAGGTRGAPKFPQAGLLEFLARAGERTGDTRYRDAVLLTLRAIASGGIYDHIGGGFARYSTDARWLAPHFEKMLYDNGQLLALLAHAYRLTGEPLFARRMEGTVAWLTREMRQPEGGFAASLDADSDGHEGRFYIWTKDEVLAVLGQDEGDAFAAAYDITPTGNWEGVSIPNRLAALAAGTVDEEDRFAAARAKLLAHRERRPRPALDDKLLADWNGLAIAGLAEAAMALARTDWLADAEHAYRHVMDTMRQHGRLAHAARAGHFVFPGLATDYAALIKAALALHDATFASGYLADAESLTATLRQFYWDSTDPGYFLTAADAEALIVRPRSATDEATPSATALMAANLVRLWRLTGNDAYRADADAILTGSGGAIANNLFATVGLLNALDLRLRATEVVIIAPEGTNPTDLLDAVGSAPSHVLVPAMHADGAALPASHPAFGKTAAGGKPTAYVCRGETCSLPVTDRAALTALLVPSATPR